MIGWEEKTLDDEKADHSYRPENGRDVICGEKGVAATTYTSSRKVFHFSSKDPGQKC